MKKITTRSCFFSLLLSLAALLALGQSSQAQSQNSGNDLFSVFAPWINSLDDQYYNALSDGYQPDPANTDWVICVDEDNGSTIEATVGQKISVMYDYPRVSTEDEKAWVTSAKSKAWTTTYSTDLLDDLYSDCGPNRHAALNLYQSQYPSNNMHRLTDADFQIAKDANNNPSYPRWCYYHSFVATAPGDASITSTCTTPAGKNKTVTIYFHITGTPSAQTSAKPTEIGTSK